MVRRRAGELLFSAQRAGIPLLPLPARPGRPGSRDQRVSGDFTCGAARHQTNRVTAAALRRPALPRFSRTADQHDIVGRTTGYSPNLGSSLVFPNNPPQRTLLLYKGQSHAAAIFPHQRVISDVWNASDVHHEVIGLTR